MSKIKKAGIIFGIILFFVPLLLGFGLFSTGPGLDSLQFINSVGDVINKYIPENTYVLDGHSAAYKLAMNKIIKNSYLADVDSTINYNNPEEMKNKEAMEQMALDAFENDWGKAIENKENVDLNEVAFKLIDLDKSIGNKFHSYGLLHSGVQWVFKSNGLNELFSHDVYQDVENQEKIMDQNEYDKLVEHKTSTISGTVVKSSIGNYLVNNKVWFLNVQISTIRSTMKQPAILNPLLKNEYDKNALDDVVVKTSDLKAPKFTQSVIRSRVGVVIFFIGVLFALNGFVVIGIYVYSNKKGKE